LQYLKIISSAVYVYNAENQIGPDRRKKFDFKARKIRFIDYGKGANQYRIWNFNINRIEEVTFISIDEKDTIMEEEYAPIYFDYENSNNPNYQSNESILSTASNRNQLEVIISEFTDNRNEYLLFESITNQVSHAPNPAIDEAELTTYEEAINGSESTA
jgi:hypothetical protein